MTIVIAAVLNGINYGLAYLITPNVNIFFLLMMLIVIPAVYNIILYKKNTLKKGLWIFPLLTTIAYIVSGSLLERSGKWDVLIEQTNRSSGDLIIQVSESIVDPSQIITLFLTQIAVLFIADKLFRKGSSSHDRSYKFE